jgi:hypothetical protein
MACLGRILVEAVKRNRLSAWGAIAQSNHVQPASISRAACIPQAHLRGYADVAEQAAGRNFDHYAVGFELHIGLAKS